MVVRSLSWMDCLSTGVASSQSVASRHRARLSRSSLAGWPSTTTTLSFHPHSSSFLALSLSPGSDSLPSVSVLHFGPASSPPSPPPTAPQHVRRTGRQARSLGLQLWPDVISRHPDWSVHRLPSSSRSSACLLVLGKEAARAILPSLAPRDTPRASPPSLPFIPASLMHPIACLWGSVWQPFCWMASVGGEGAVVASLLRARFIVQLD